MDREQAEHDQLSRDVHEFLTGLSVDLVGEERDAFMARKRDLLARIESERAEQASRG